jgi:hypothetical protein
MWKENIPNETESRRQAAALYSYGDFVIENEHIDGEFRVGATGEVLSAIPGAREKVLQSRVVTISGRR